VISREIAVAKSSEIREGQAFSLEVDGQPIVIFRHRSKLFAMRNRCPHQGAPLSDGVLMQGHIVCIYHGWRFALKDGAFTGNPNLKIPTYPVCEKEGRVLLVLSEKDEK
jgi:nitrite reductase/ring-hydroxylating ferredoxin subunit